MKKALILMTALILSGCAAANVSMIDKDGNKKEASSIALFTDLKSGEGDFKKETFKFKGMEGNLDLQTLITILQAAAAAQ